MDGDCRPSNCTTTGWPGPVRVGLSQTSALVFPTLCRAGDHWVTSDWVNTFPFVLNDVV